MTLLRRYEGQHARVNFDLKIFRPAWSSNLPDVIADRASTHGLTMESLEIQRGFFTNTLKIAASGACTALSRFMYDIEKMIEVKN